METFVGQTETDRSQVSFSPLIFFSVCPKSRLAPLSRQLPPAPNQVGAPWWHPGTSWTLSSCHPHIPPYFLILFGANPTQSLLSFFNHKASVQELCSGYSLRRGMHSGVKQSPSPLVRRRQLICHQSEYFIQGRRACEEPWTLSNQGSPSKLSALRIKIQGEGCSSVIECLPSMFKALDSSPTTKERLKAWVLYSACSSSL